MGISYASTWFRHPCRLSMRSCILRSKLAPVSPTSPAVTGPGSPEGSWGPVDDVVHFLMPMRCACLEHDSFGAELPARRGARLSQNEQVECQQHFID